MSEIRIQLHRTEIGELVLGSCDGRLCLIGFGDRETRRGAGGVIARRLSATLVDRDDGILESTRRQIDEYLGGRRTEFDIPLLMVGTDFQSRVWRELMKVPYGATATYSQIARRMGNERAARAVGNACKVNPIAIIVPCHRIIGGGGALVGYGGGLSLKERLLKLERTNAGERLK